MSVRGLPGIFARIVLLGVLSSVASGCVLFLAGGAVGSAVVIADRRSTGMQIEDAEIEHRVNHALDDHFSRQSVRIDVTSYNQKVLLAGEVPSNADRDYAERLAAVQENVGQVYNELTINSLAGLSNKTDDELLAAKVRADLLQVNGLPGGIVKTTCTDGVIFLFGKLAHDEADLAKRAASRVDGVKRVVALFDLVSDADMDQYRSEAFRHAAKAPHAGSAN